MKTEIKKITSKSLDEAKEILFRHGVVAIPTETVYGLGAIGTDGLAVKKIFEIKGRPSDNPLIAHVHKDYDISKLVLVEQDYVRDLVNAFMPGPLTLVMKSKRVVCDEATCGGDTLAIRMPSHEGCAWLLRLIDEPIVAPSANLSKHTSPVTAMHVKNDLDGKIPLILDGGKCAGGIESTVLDVTSETPRILRLGLVTKEMIEKVVGRCEIAMHKEGDKVKSPGVKYRHYCPKCQTEFFYPNDLEKAIEKYLELEKEGKKVYLLGRNSILKGNEDKNLLLLGETGEEIASNLYDKLLEGEKKADVIIGIAMDSEGGVFDGIMNRMVKSFS